MTRSCNYCGQTVCTDHRLPESHSCDAADQATPPRARRQTNSVRSTLLSHSWLPKTVGVVVVVVLAVGLLGGVGGDENSEFDAEAAEAAALDRINEARKTNGLEPLGHSTAIERRATDWSQTMADEDSLFHGSGQCQYSGENVAMTYWRTTVTTDRGTEVFINSNDELGTELANQWLNSTPHRENIMRPGFAESGIGIVKTTGGGGREAVYATQRFCG